MLQIVNSFAYSRICIIPSFKHIHNSTLLLLRILNQIFKKKVKEIPYSEIEEISYKQGNMNRLFKNGTIVIKRDTHNIMEKILIHLQKMEHFAFFLKY